MIEKKEKNEYGKESIAQMEARIAEQSRIIRGLMKYLERVKGVCADGECNESNGDGLLYAVYEVAIPGKSVFVAVCIDNPFLYAACQTHCGAVGAIKEKLAEFYGLADDDIDELDGLQVPNFLPEDI